MPLRTVLIGAGGYAANYVRKLQHQSLAEHLELVAVVDPYASQSEQYENFKHLPIFSQPEEFFANHTADLAIVSSPIHRHFDQCMAALDAGVHVLCEKPLVPTISQLNQLSDKAKANNLTLAVGFQLSYAKDMMQIKERILAGEFGRAISMKAFVSWPRDWAYFNRGSGWAGKRFFRNGLLVNDAVASNATAHYIHNMLFLLGESMNTAAPVTGLAAECYRANDIETFDTIVFRGKAAGADVFYTATHTAQETIQPLLEYKFEKADIKIQIYIPEGHTITHANGRVEKISMDIDHGEWNKLINTADCIKGQATAICDVETVRPITQLLDDIFANVSFQPFKDGSVIQDEEKGCTYVQGLLPRLLEGHEQGKLPSEMGGV